MVLAAAKHISILIHILTKSAFNLTLSIASIAIRLDRLLEFRVGFAAITFLVAECVAATCEPQDLVRALHW